MRSPHPLRNGDAPRIPPAPFHSTVAVHKLKRFNYLILVFRLAAFCFSLASSIFMLTNSRDSTSPRWSDFDEFRLVFAANTIVALYSLFEMAASVWEISRNATILPEILQVWFDFGHDQVFAYLLLSADAGGAVLARRLRAEKACTEIGSGFCIQSEIAVALGFGGFLFIGLSSLLSGFRVACFIINGSRIHL